MSHRERRSTNLFWYWFMAGIPTLLLALQLSSHPSQIVPALLIPAGFAWFAWLLRGVTLSGAVAGFLVTAILFLSGGTAMFGAVFLVFILTLAATRFGRSQKRRLGIAERPTGRDAAQVFANVGVAAAASAGAGLRFLTLGAFHPHVPSIFSFTLAAGAIAALAEAAADTVSSETGKALSGTARMITTWRTVPSGTDGAISLVGTIAGVMAAIAVGVEVVLSDLLDSRTAGIAVACGILGMHFDSLLGATLECRGRLTNNSVNLLSTAFSALLAVLLTWQFA